MFFFSFLTFEKWEVKIKYCVIRSFINIIEFNIIICGIEYKFTSLMFSYRAHSPKNE